MTTHQSRPALAALAAAVFVLSLAACGGGGGEAPPDQPGSVVTSAAPVVTITNNVSDETATGPVTFTFSFNRDVGTSFTADDVTVTGGVKGAFTRLSGTSATLVVTPNASSTGTLQITVAANNVTDATGTGNAAVSASKAFNTALPPPPATAIPAGSTVIYSDAAVVAGIDTFPAWGQSPPVVGSEVTIAGNKSLRYVFGALYQGIDWAGSPQNVSSKTTLHLDFFSPDITSVKVSLISAGKENAVTRAITPGSWNAIDIDLAEYTVPDKTAIIQIKLEPNVAGTLYVDNIYFHGTAGGGSTSCGTTAPTCAPTAGIPTGSTVIYSDAAVVAGIDTFPVWGQSPPVAGSEVTIAGNKSLRYTFGALYQGIDWAGSPQNVSTRRTLHLDVWTADIASVKISLIGGGAENGVTRTLTARAWTRLDIDLSLYTSPDKTGIIQMKIEPNVTGTLYVDNIHFAGSTSSSGGSSGPLTFSTGFATGNRTIEGGEFGGFSGSNFDGFNCNGQPINCGGGGEFSPTQSAANSFFFYYYTTPSPAEAMYMGVYVQAPGVVGGFSPAADTPGVQVTSQTTLKFKLGQNAEWFSSSTNNFVIVMDLGKRYPPNGNNCRLQLRRVVTPTAQAATDYAIPLSSFAVVQDCGAGFTTPAQALAASPISQIAFQGVGGTNALSDGVRTSGANRNVPNGEGRYPTTIVLQGGITID
jgi:polyisoprenoid-binding protein YceI